MKFILLFGIIIILMSCFTQSKTKFRIYSEVSNPVDFFCISQKDTLFKINNLSTKLDTVVYLTLKRDGKDLFFFLSLKDSVIGNDGFTFYDDIGYTPKEVSINITVEGKIKVKYK